MKATADKKTEKSVRTATTPVSFKSGFFQVRRRKYPFDENLHYGVDMPLHFLCRLSRRRFRCCRDAQQWHVTQACGCVYRQGANSFHRGSTARHNLFSLLTLNHLKKHGLSQSNRTLVVEEKKKTLKRNGKRRKAKERAPTRRSTRIQTDKQSRKKKTQNIHSNRDRAALLV
jgi:hypothetical protein